MMELIQNIEEWLQGKKAYTVMIGAILLAIGGFLHGELSMAQAINALIAALGLGAIRSAIGKVSIK